MAFIFPSLFFTTGCEAAPIRNLVPTDRRLVEIDEHLFGFGIFLETPGTKFATIAGLLVAAPRRFDVGRLHVIDPDDAGAERFHHAEGFVDVARPDSAGEPVGRVVGDADGVGFAVERNYGRDRAEDLFASDARTVIHIVENSRLDIVALVKLLRPAATDGDLSFFLADFEISGDAVVLLFADQRSHLGVALKRRAELNVLGLFGHGLDECRIDLLFDKDAAARGADFALVDKDAEERAVDGGLPIGIGEKDVRRLATELKRDALQGICGTLHDGLADGGAAGEGDLIHAGMRDECSAGRFPHAVDHVDYAGR